MLRDGRKLRPRKCSLHEASPQRGSSFFELHLGFKVWDVTIRRITPVPDPDDFPPAKLYLDDVREIVNVLAPPAGPGQEDQGWVLSYRVKDRTCDTLDELAQIGGKTRHIEIHF